MEKGIKINLLFSTLDVLTDPKGILESVKFSDMVLTYTPATNQLAYSSQAFKDPKLLNTPLFFSFGKDEEMLSQSLAYIYASCQRNKLLHPCLLLSLTLHSLKASKDIAEAEELYQFLNQMFRIEFIFDPDKSSQQVLPHTFHINNFTKLLSILSYKSV